MLLSQFLTKNLFIHCTSGQDYFRQYFIHYHNPSNLHPSHSSPSTPTHPLPYFTIFNPIPQTHRFHAQAYFIKTHLEIFNHLT
ncbi:FAD-binding domain-containing protein, partial [Staphylococcus saprophyticus]|uniref:FAD-binding domain-containing protein n=1 Tax=Staphylococcus saprophyticus TaxID=29385 RepID=UPI0028CB71AA